MSNWTIISLGGSIIVPDAIDVSFLKKFRKLVLSHSDRKFAIICGGGGTNRRYNSAATKLDSNAKDVDLDWIGIRALQLNAELVRVMFGKHAHNKVVENAMDLKALPGRQIVIGSADMPGRSSDYDAVIWAKRLKATTVINLSNIDRVFTADPRKVKSAQPILDTTWTEYMKIVGTKWSPRMSTPFDPIAAQLAKKIGLTAYVMNGHNLTQLKKVIAGDATQAGTVLHP
jgi:uridylate kinase